MVISCGKGGKKTKTNTQNYKQEEVTIEGTYSYSNKNEGLECEISIYGDSWSGVTSMWGNVEYQNGIMNKNSLYDESGYVRIGSANGRTLHTTFGSGTSITLHKQ